MKKKTNTIKRRLRTPGMVAILAFASSLTGCCILQGSDGGCYSPPGWTNSESSTVWTRDVLSDIAALDEEALGIQGDRYANQFALTSEQGLGLARVVRDFAALSDRTDQDLAEFAQRLYGLSPVEIVSAVQESRLGNREQMNELVDRAATRFGTDSETMKAVIQELHGAALREAGVSL